VLLVDEWQRAGLEIVFLNHALGASPEDELLLQVQGMIAEYARAKILERSRRGKRHKAQVGAVSVLAGARYGYRYVTVGEGGGQARYEVCEEEAPVVRQVFAWVGRERLSIGEVCRRLRAAGVPTRSGKRWWDRTSVWDMLRNPAYRGEAAFGKTRAGALRPRRGARYLLQGLVVCACCGYAYYGKPVSNRARQGHPRDYAYYRCVGTDAYRFGGQRVCTNPQVRTERLVHDYERRLQAAQQPPGQGDGDLLDKADRQATPRHQPLDRRLQRGLYRQGRIRAAHPPLQGTP